MSIWYKQANSRLIWRNAAHRAASRRMSGRYLGSGHGGVELLERFVGLQLEV